MLRSPQLFLPTCSALFICLIKSFLLRSPQQLQPTSSLCSSACLISKSFLLRSPQQFQPTSSLCSSACLISKYFLLRSPQQFQPTCSCSPACLISKSFLLRSPQQFQPTCSLFICLSHEQVFPVDIGKLISVCSIALRAVPLSQKNVSRSLCSLEAVARWKKHLSYLL